MVLPVDGSNSNADIFIYGKVINQLAALGYQIGTKSRDADYYLGYMYRIGRGQDAVKSGWDNVFKRSEVYTVRQYDQFFYVRLYDNKQFRADPKAAPGVVGVQGDQFGIFIRPSADYAKAYRSSIQILWPRHRRAGCRC